MNVRVMLIAALALQGCDWAAGERIARCNAGDLSQCDDAGVGDAGAGASDAGASDAGMNDAGTSDAGADAGMSDDAGARDAGVDAGPVMTTFGLYPNVAGGLWHVFNEGGRGVVQVVADDGGVPRALRLGGAVVQAYADSQTSTWLALLVDTGGASSSLVVVDPFDGGTFETQASADIISVYRSPLGVDTVSLWSSSGGRYQQDLLAPLAGSRTFLPTPLGNVACSITFDDLEVLRPPLDRVVIAYRTQTCSPVAMSVIDGVASNDAGIQFITADGQRGAVEGHVRGARQRVGRSGTNAFNIATQNGAIQPSKFVWGGSTFSVTGCAPISLATGTLLELGDVSDGLVTGIARGDLVVGQLAATLDATTAPTAFLARVCDVGTPWVVSLGPATPGTRVPVLVQDGRVFVSVQRPDGGVELLSRDAGP